MPEAQTILNMIETVDPKDSAKLDEIDARVWCYTKQYLFSNRICKMVFEEIQRDDKGYYLGLCKHRPKKYTKSRDALKAIRPEGWHWCAFSTGIAKCFNKNKEFDSVCATEELAELHAIIQAIDYERNSR